MNEEQLKNILTSYVRSEMELVRQEEMEGYDHEFSPQYNKKIQKVLRSKKTFVKKICTRKAARRVAAVVLLIVSLISVTDISARMFGLKPWKYISSFDEETIMDVKEYVGTNEDISHDSDLPEITTDIPEYYPDVLIQKEAHEGINDFCVQWEGPDGAEMRYQRIDMIGSMSMMINSECDYKEKVSIAGYEGCCYVRGKYCWLQWDDTMYCHWLDVYNIDDADSELVRVAESFY